MKDLTLMDLWLLDATNEELKDFVESEPYNKQTTLFLNWMLERFESTEEYERCVIIRNELEYRRDLRVRLKENKFFDE